MSAPRKGTPRIAELIVELKALQESYRAASLLDSVGSADKINEPDLAIMLQFAGALLRNVVAPQPRSGRFHVAVFGGTQVGKSTVINSLCGSASARVHHTAGFTRHAQAFVASAQTCQNILADLPQAFAGFQCVAVSELSTERPREFGVAQLQGPPAIQHVVFWDAPDCDAVDASRFSDGLIEAITVADVVVYVTSREKYAVNAILKWLLLLTRAGVPVVTCLNMVPAEQQSDVANAMCNALAYVAANEQPSPQPLAPAPIFAYEFLTTTQLQEIYSGLHPTTLALRSEVESVARAGRKRNRAADALMFLETIAPMLAAPAISQLQNFAHWETSLRTALDLFVADYRNSYLDNPQRYDAFNHVGVEILALLNPPIPGLRKALVIMRTALSLPARAIIFGTRAVWRYFTSGPAGAQRASISNEEVSLREANDRLLNGLGGLAMQRGAEPAQPFWNSLKREWSEVAPTLAQGFRTKLDDHRARTEQWVRETAEGIYQELARDPVRLNLLRTGRISADAAAIIVSISTGAHGDVLHDLLVTPAMMSLVEAITQQLASSYVEQRRKELRERLLADTRDFAEQVYGVPMRQMASTAMERAGFAGFDIAQLSTLGERFAEMRRQYENSSPNSTVNM